MSVDHTFYFYDLETSGVNPRDARIMQFAGQRTNLHLEPVGEPHDILIKLTDEILPEPDAIFITGITPQKTVTDGVTEVEFLRMFHEQIATPGTIFVGFNTIRFDDEFMRYAMWRNFYDAYEWQWKDQRSRWDLLDVVRMTRALRPDGIHWPFASDGRPTNRLELITQLNGLDHTKAHDALSDVHATIAVARLIRDKQPKLFDYLLQLRDKRKVAELVESGKPFVYSSGKYSSEHEKTTVAVYLDKNPKKQGALVYDLRHNPAEFMSLSPQELMNRWQWTRDEAAPKRLPVKTLQYNRCPAIAPEGVLDQSTRVRLDLDDKTIAKHLTILRDNQQEFVQNLYAALELMNKQQQTTFVQNVRDVDALLYEGFVAEGDRARFAGLHQTAPEFDIAFQDERLRALLPLYKARNYPKILTDEDRTVWEKFRTTRLLDGGQKSRAARYFARLQELASRDGLTNEQQYLLEELQLWGQSILPVEDI
jgi:exodeoxyribonuclease-1